jgi:hypothetical protein
MTRATWLLAATSVVGVALTIYLYLDNRSLEQQLAAARSDKPAPAATEKVAVRAADPWTPATRTPGARTGSGPAPSLPEPKEETRLERRARRQQELAAMLGRLNGESEEEYRNRVMPMITTGLLVPRTRADEMRKEAEAKAGVTPEQSKKLDQAFEKVYADAIDYTNKAVADGLLSPYEPNVSGLLEYAGGLGGVFNEANGQIGQILSPQQMKAMSQTGFQWGEYLGFKAPWEQLRPPPPPK